MAEITELLAALGAGDPGASRALFERAYHELKRMAHKRLQSGERERGLDTTSLVHEAFLRFTERGELQLNDRRAFFGYIGRIMRSVVIDAAREQLAAKRGGGVNSVTLTTNAGGESFDSEQLLSLDAALTTLERLAPDLHRVVELRYFAGLGVDDVADLLGISARTVTREWAKARAMLSQLMSEGAAAR